MCKPNVGSFVKPDFSLQHYKLLSVPKSLSLLSKLESQTESSTEQLVVLFPIVVVDESARPNLTAGGGERLCFEFQIVLFGVLYSCIGDTSTRAVEPL